ncbi:hypothetical protein PRIC1_004890 [Phytophthora ramorum]|uniref:HTH psq-type domain-containing protein n=1 Tax=Phytophthora ramorum TaxID=164328 RepID=H3H1H5_PHYRM|nr:hypothetical protein KRP23_4643 [Phytophthora ramorum]
MAPSDRPANSPIPILDHSESPVARSSEYRVYLHPRQPFIRYEYRRRHPNSRIPNQGQADRLPGVASLLRRQNAMQARGVISPVRDPLYDSEERHFPEGNRTFECWTPPRFASDSDSNWLPSTSALKTAHSRLSDWSSDLDNYEVKSVDPALGQHRIESTKTSSPMTRSPEPVRETSESRPKTSRYLREIDRRRILMRIAQGEKQSALAKEYHVSRAAICNLNKHRAEVLSRNHEHPLAKHPKRRMLAKVKRQEAMDNQASDSSGRSG